MSKHIVRRNVPLIGLLTVGIFMYYLAYCLMAKPPDMQHVHDYARILTPSQHDEIERNCRDVYSRYSVRVIVIVTASPADSVETTLQKGRLYYQQNPPGFSAVNRNLPRMELLLCLNQGSYPRAPYWCQLNQSPNIDYSPQHLNGWNADAINTLQPAELLQYMTAKIDQSVAQRISSATWHGRLVSLGIVLMASGFCVIGAFMWTLCLVIRVADNRYKPWWILPCEVIVGTAAVVLGFKCLLYVMGWPEFAPEVYGLPGFFLSSLLFTPLLHITRKLRWGGLSATVGLLAAIYMGITSYINANHIASNIPLSLCRSASLGLTGIGFVALLIRGCLRWTGDTSTGFFGDLRYRVGLIDRSLCLRAGKPAPRRPTTPQEYRQWLFQLPLESSFAYPPWILLQLYCAWSGQFLRNKIAEKGWSRWRRYLTSLHGFRYERAVWHCIGKAEANLQSPELAISYAHEGLSLLSSLTPRCPDADRTMSAYQLQCLLGKAYTLRSEPQNAREALNRALPIAENISYCLQIHPQMLLGRLDHKHGDFASAVEAYEKALRLVARMESDFYAGGSKVGVAAALRLSHQDDILRPGPDSLGVLHSFFADLGPLFGDLNVIKADIGNLLKMCLDAWNTADQAVAENTQLRDRRDELEKASQQVPTANTILVDRNTSAGKLYFRVAPPLIMGALNGLFQGLGEDEFTHIKNDFANHPFMILKEDRSLSVTGSALAYEEEATQRCYALLEEIFSTIESTEPVDANTVAFRELQYQSDVDPSGSGNPDSDSSDLAALPESVMTSMVSYYYALLYRAPFDESVWSKLERELKRSDEELSWENFMEVVRSIDAATTADAGQFAWLAKKEDGNFFPVFVRMLRDRLLQNAENLGRSRTACCFLLRVTAWLKDTEAAAESLLALADIALTNNHPYATLSLAVMAHKAAEENENIYAVIRAGVLEGRALRVLRKERMSVSCFEDAIAHIEDSRRRLLTPDQQALYLAMQIDAYAELITTFVDLGLNVQALEYAERSKARSLVDLLSNRKLKVRDHSAHELLAEEASLQEKLDSLKRQIRQSRQAEPNPADLRDSHEEAGINEAETERHQDLPVLLADAQRKLSTIKQRIRKSSGEWASLTNATPLAYADPAANNDLCRMLRGSLGPLMEKSVVLQYYVTQDETLIFVVPAWEGAGDGVTVHRSPLGIARLQELTRDDFLSTIVEASEDPTFLEELYTHLFQPVLPDLSRLEATAILFAPHSYLHALPLQAMYYQEAGNRRYVIDDYPCGFIPNISTLEHLSAKRQPRGTAALIMGNPRQAEDTDGDLPFAEQETRYVADILQAVPLVREKATKDALMKQVADKQVIHLACHGFYSSTDPLQSHLVLADGSLQVDEVLDLELEANLVTLSACSSGVSKISTGDELVGMARAWLYAGTPSVIASQWDIDDDSSSEIITLFYRNWIQDGQSKMRALQNAQKEAKDGWHTHPRSWAAFNLIGDPL